ncbi:MAG: sulfotransferase domain-containing protein [Deinococcales bacterium]
MDRGFYLKQLEGLWEYFPKSQLLILRHETLRDEPLKTLNGICDFLGIKPFESLDVQKVYLGSYPNPMAEQEKIYLKGVFEEEIARLEQKLGWDCQSWLEL